MDFWYALIGVVALTVSFPYLRCFFKRLICMLKIKRVCKRNGYRLHATHPFWFLGRKQAQKCDLYVETANEVFAIKLFGMPKRPSILILQENGQYRIRSFIVFISYGRGVWIPLNGKHKPLPSYDFRYRYPSDWAEKTARQILLINPVSMSFHYQPQHGRETAVNAGDTVNGMEIDSLPQLLEDLQAAAQPPATA